MLTAGLGLTSCGAEPGHLLGHQRPLPVSAVDLDDLLPTLAAFGPGQGRDGLLPADLAPRRLLPRFPAGRRLGPVERRLPTGPLRGRGDGGPQGAGLEDEGAVVAGAPGANGGELEELVGGFGRLVLGVFGPSPQVTVAVKVLGDRVLVGVAVQVRFLLRPVGTVLILPRRT